MRWARSRLRRRSIPDRGVCPVAIRSMMAARSANTWGSVPIVLVSEVAILSLPARCRAMIRSLSYRRLVVNGWTCLEKSGGFARVNCTKPLAKQKVCCLRQDCRSPPGTTVAIATSWWATGSRDAARHQRWWRTGSLLRWGRYQVSRKACEPSEINTQGSVGNPPWFAPPPADRPRPLPESCRPPGR